VRALRADGWIHVSALPRSLDVEPFCSRCRELVTDDGWYQIVSQEVRCRWCANAQDAETTDAAIR
jgi:hypothetical protein